MIPLFTLTRQNKILAKELEAAYKEVVARGSFILGPKVAEFEEKFAKYLGMKYAVGVASGTDAISLALLAIGVLPGDEIIMPANAYPSVFAVTAIGTVPQLVDIDPDTYNIDPTKIERAITKRTKAILPVHLYGQPAQMREILEIGKKYKIPIVEDCAQAAGAEVKISTNTPISTNKPMNVTMKQSNNETMKVGSIGDVGCFSFYPTKNLGAFGDGGMVVTNNPEIYQKVKLLRMYGEESRYHSVILGRNSRLDELQAAILLVKLKYLDKWNERRREIAELYLSYFVGPAAISSGSNEVFFADVRLPLSRSNSLSSSSLSESLSPDQGKRSRIDIRQTFKAAQKTHSSPEYTPVYHLFVIRSKKRDQLKKYLEEKGIGTAIHYPVPIHLVPSLKFLGYKKGDFPEAEIACEQILSLPMYPELADEEVKIISNTINEFLS